MNITFLILVLVLLSAGVMAIATSSIAIECGNEQPAYYTDKRKEHKNFLIATLVAAISSTLLSFPGMYFAFQAS